MNFLLQELRLKDAASVLEIIQKYYPKNMIKPATKLLIAESS